jgi:predicted nucleotidyltransferase
VNQATPLPHPKETSMNLPPLIETRRQPLESLCRRYAVRQLRLFGSAATGLFEPEHSDLDFLVEFDRPEGMDKFEQYFGLQQDLAKLFGRKVDLVDWNAAKNPFFRAEAESEAKIVYGS